MPLKSANRSVPSNPTGPLQGDPPPEIPRDQWGRPLVIPYSCWQGPNVWTLPTAMTRASTLGGTLEDQYNLGQWRMGQVALGMGKRRDLQLAAATLTAAPHDKQRRYDVAWQAFEAAESDAAATVGTSLHHLADRIDRDESVPDVGEYNVTLDAYRGIASYFRFHAIELFLVNEELGAAGTADRLGELREGWTLTAPDGTVFGPGDPLVTDLKSSSTADYFGVKFTVQFAVYAGGRPYRHLAERSIGRGKAIEVKGEYLDWPGDKPPSPDWGLIIHAPAGQQEIALEDMLHWVPLEAGRELAHRANQVREDRKATWIVPAGLPVAVEHSVIGTAVNDAQAGETVQVVLNGQVSTPQIHPADLAVMVRDAESEDEIHALWEAHSDAWTEECTVAASAVISRLNQPDHVRKLALLAEIKQALDEDTITDLWGDHSDIWDDDCTRMAEAVLRNL